MLRALLTIHVTKSHHSNQRHRGSCKTHQTIHFEYNFHLMLCVVLTLGLQELLLGKTYGRSVDIWSLGCTIIEMATGIMKILLMFLTFGSAKPPWFEEFPDPTAAMYHIGSSQDIPKFPKDLSEDASDFLLSCLKRDPKERATVATLIQHPFVNPI
jgi:serine/threonine protein kinase